MNHEEPDHVPLVLRFFHRNFLMDKTQEWHNQFERADQLIKLGLDDFISVYAPLPYAPEVEVRTSRVSQPGEKYPVLVKEYETPKGVLRHAVRQTPDWPHGDEVPILDDFTVPEARTKKYPVENMQDLRSLSCLFSEPKGKELNYFREYMRKVRSFGRQRNVLVEAEGPFLGDGAIWLCGVRRVLVSTIKNTEFIHRLLGIIHEWDMMRIRLIIEVGGADIIFHRGWYESPVFWSPKAYKTFLAPLIREEIELVHKAGLKFGYIMTRRQSPLYETLKGLGVDVLFGPDPVEGEIDNAEMKRVIGDKICLWGGVNSFVTLEFGTAREIRDAVAESVEKLAPGGGFILSAVDCITGKGPGVRETPTASLASFIDTWSRLGDYSSRRIG